MRVKESGRKEGRKDRNSIKIKRLKGERVKGITNKQIKKGERV